MDASQGLTILFASGDKGAKPDGTNLGTEFPASDPNVLAVGATNLNLAGCGISACTGYGTESGASISGGGYSGYFPEPFWQADTIGSLSGRGVPDVSMFGDSPGYWVYSSYLDDPTDNCHPSTTVTSAWFGCAGTSLSTPLWAGVLAVALQVRGGGSFGNIDPLIYELGASSSYSTIFHDITSGSNNGYSAGPGWDPVTGWGSPIANTLAAALVGENAATDRSSYYQGDTIYFTGTGFTADGSISSCLSTSDSGSSLLCIPGEQNANAYGDVSGSMSVGINIPTGPQLFYLVDSTTGRFSTPVKLEINPSTTDSISLTLTEPTAPIGLFELSGCSVSLTSVPGDGTPYSFTADPNCQVTVTAPSAGANTQYLFPGGSTSESFFTCASGTCGEQSYSYYEQLLMTISYSVSDGSLAPSSPTITGLQLGSTYSQGLTTSPSLVWLDMGSSWSISSGTLSGSTSTQQWIAPASALSGVITIPSTISPEYFHQYYVTFATTPSGSGSTSVTSGWYNAGSVNSIAASSNSGYTFSSWSSSTTSIVIASRTSKTTTATVDGSGTITAEFATIGISTKLTQSLAASPRSIPLQLP